MAEKVKKEKAPAKPRAKAATPRKAAATVKKTTVAEANGKPTVVKTASPEAIASLAYRYWKERGGQNGQDWQDWLRAERELTSS